MFFYEFCGIRKITLFEEHLQTAASVRCCFSTMSLKQSGFCSNPSFKILVSERRHNINLINRESRKK